MLHEHAACCMASRQLQHLAQKRCRIRSCLLKACDRQQQAYPTSWLFLRVRQFVSPVSRHQRC